MSAPSSGPGTQEVLSHWVLNEPVQERGGDHGRCHISRTPESSKKTGFGRGSSMAYLGSCDPPCKAPAFCEASGVAVTPPLQGQLEEKRGGRAGGKAAPATNAPLPPRPGRSRTALSAVLIYSRPSLPLLFSPF